MMKKNNGFIIGVLLAFALAVLIYGISWIGTCAIIKLITLCFGWTFKWSIATGIWLLIFILKSIFKSNVNVKK